jgi:hypothetical protein
MNDLSHFNHLDNMGYFRKFKLSDYSIEDCRKAISIRERDIAEMARANRRFEMIQAMEEWACFRELLARHENQNASPLDKDTPG